MAAVTSNYRYMTAVIVTTAENTNKIQNTTKYAALSMLINIYNGPFVIKCWPSLL